MNQEKKLCTCGKSKNPPYCDHSHEETCKTAAVTMEKKLCTCGKSKNPPYCDHSHLYIGKKTEDTEKVKTKIIQDDGDDFGF